ncbi:hypothetical protein ACLKMY_34445 [Paraburkholderia mimosarum]
MDLEQGLTAYYVGVLESLQIFASRQLAAIAEDSDAPQILDLVVPNVPVT